jgi:hypothetical protein
MTPAVRMAGLRLTYLACIALFTLGPDPWTSVSPVRPKQNLLNDLGAAALEIPTRTG